VPICVKGEGVWAWGMRHEVLRPLSEDRLGLKEQSLGVLLKRLEAPAGGLNLNGTQEEVGASAGSLR